MDPQPCVRLNLCLIIGLAILTAVVITTAVTTNTSTKARLEMFATPAAGAATAITGPSSLSSFSSAKQFIAVLTGDNEVPPVDTEATGRIKLTVNYQQNALDYQLSLSNVNSIVNGAHIHWGSVGTNGPIVASLNIGGTFAGASAFTSGGGGGSTMTSTSTGGTITSADLKGPLLGKQISDLIRLIQYGKAYVNVHTDRNQNGEMRGQLKPSLS